MMRLFIRRAGQGLVLLALTLSSCETGGPSTESRPGGIMVLCSDAQVDKYKLAQEAFLTSLGGKAELIDLERSGMSESRLSRHLRKAPPEAVYCIGTRAYLAANRVLKKESIILSSAINWQRLNPGQKSLVIANELPAESQVTLYRYFFPKVRRIGVLCSAEYNRQWAEQAVEAGREAGVEVVIEFVSRTSHVRSGLKKLIPQVDALWINADPVVFSGVDAIRSFFEQADAGGKPVFAYSAAFAEFGSTLMISPDNRTIGRQAAGLLQARRSGEAPPPVTSPAGTAIVLNMKAVSRHGLELNEDALDSVNRIIR